MVYAVEQDRPDVMQQQNAWETMIYSMDPIHLVFSYESGINIDMTRHYNRSKGKKRVVDSATLNIPKSTTLISVLMEALFLWYFDML